MSRDDLEVIPLTARRDVRQAACSQPDRGENWHKNRAGAGALRAAGAKSPARVPGRGTAAARLTALDVCFRVTVAVQANRSENSRLAGISGILLAVCVSDPFGTGCAGWACGAGGAARRARSLAKPPLRSCLHSLSCSPQTGLTGLPAATPGADQSPAPCPAPWHRVSPSSPAGDPAGRRAPCPWPWALLTLPVGSWEAAPCFCGFSSKRKACKG